MKRFSAVLAILFCLSLPVSAREPSLSAAGAVLWEPTGDTVLYEKDAHTRRPMASTTKIMTALVALEHLPTDTVVTVPQEAVGVEGSSVYLKAGDRWLAEDLLYAVLLQSANDASVAVAVATAGSVQQFAVLMNEKAASLGLTDTHFVNPHGLDDPDHYTTAEDLARLAGAALENQQFARIVGTKSVTVGPVGDGEATHTLVNHNKLLRIYDGAVGVKTGFTRTAGRCLVSAATRGGVTLIAVTLSAPDDWNDHRALLDYGFSCLETVMLGDEPVETRLPVTGGISDSVLLKTIGTLSVVLPKSHGPVTSRIESMPFLSAPLSAGDKVGCVVFSVDGKDVGSLPLTVTDPVPAVPEKPSLWKRIVHFNPFKR